MFPLRPLPHRPVFRPPRPVPYRRLVRLYAGLALYGASDALVIRAALGLDPWDVLHQGLARHSGVSIGVVSIVVGAAVLLLWWPIRQRPGLGTVSNVVLVGATIDATLALVPHHQALAYRVPLLVTGVLLNGLATGLYITARFGPGPRDGLMTGLHRRTGRSLRLIRTGIELSVLAAGYALGGGVGPGTVLYALAIGPLAQFFLRVLALPDDPVGPARGRVVAGSGVLRREAREPNPEQCGRSSCSLPPRPASSLGRPLQELGRQPCGVPGRTSCSLPPRPASSLGRPLQELGRQPSQDTI